jgi:transposase
MDKKGPKTSSCKDYWIIKSQSVLFGATSLKEKQQQLFRQYDWFDENTFLDYLKQIHRKFTKCYLFLDKAKQHYKSKKVIQYFADNKDSLIPVYLPTASPVEFMVLEEIWHIAKNDFYSIIHLLQIS